MDDIMKVAYSPESNQTYVDSAKGLGQLGKFKKSQRILKHVFEDISSRDGTGIHLDTCLAYTCNALVLSDDAAEFLSLIVYPSRGEIDRYVLNSKQDFFQMLIKILIH